MEHRCYERLPIELEVEVLRQGGLVGRFKTRDISPDGLSLAVDEQARIRGHEVLDLRVKTSLCAPFTLRGWVVHHAAGVAGIMFLNHDSRCMHLISELNDKRVA